MFKLQRRPFYQVELVLKEEKSKRLTTIPVPQKKNPINWKRFLPKYNELVEKARRRFTHSPAKSSTWTKFSEGMQLIPKDQMSVPAYQERTHLSLYTV